MVVTLDRRRGRDLIQQIINEINMVVQLTDLL